ncbi:PucR family transcriptional regulator [Blastococcus sp. SYSU D00820]
MPVTVGSLLRDPSLSLRRCTPADAADRPVSWVHVSELADPTPFLDGGELLLTTGLTLGDDVAGYVARLVDAGVAALGFGTGVAHDAVPPALVSAAEAGGLTVLEVPRRTPFIAISRSVAAALAAEEYATVARSASAQQDLARAALRAGEGPALLTRLARSVGGWVLLLDGAGQPVEAVPAAAAARAAELSGELAQLRRARPPASAAVSGPEATVLLQSLGTGTRPRGFLVVGREGPVPPAERLLVNTAALLLTLRGEQSRALDDARAALRSALLELLLAGDAAAARTALGRIGEQLPREPVVVHVAQGTPAQRAAAVEVAGELTPGAFAAERDGVLVVLAGTGMGAELAARVPGLAVGSSAALPESRLAEGLEQARQAAARAARGSRRAVGFADLAAEGVTALLDPGAAEAFAASLLAPLSAADEDGGELLRSLRTWLAHHGQWEPAAADLGVHRHTLRRRMARAEQLLGRDLDSAGVRAELWLALQLLR